LEKNHDPFCAICNKESTRNDEREMQRWRHLIQITI
jgi:hypothetical protein